MDYRIIGGDGQEYGPVPESTIREWIADGRLNSFSKIRPADEPGWSTVGELPEFSAALVAPERSSPATAAIPGRIDVGECLSVAFSLFGKHWVPLVLGALIYLAMSLAFGLVLSVLSTPFSMSIQEMVKGGTASPLLLTWQIPLYLVPWR